MTTNQQAQIDLALGLAHFSASATAVIVAALARGEPIDDKMIRHLLDLLQKGASTAPAAAATYFDSLRRTLEGKHYKGV